MAKYERELRDIFLGEEETIERIGKTMDQEDVDAYRQTIENPFEVIRGAGSLGIDITAYRGTTYIPIEVKSLQDEKLYFSNSQRLQDQLQEFIEASKRSKSPVLYMFRVKGISGEKWSVHRAHSLDDTLHFSSVPPFSRTRTGSKLIKFSEGMPLSTFLRDQVLLE